MCKWCMGPSKLCRASIICKPGPVVSHGYVQQPFFHGLFVVECEIKWVGGWVG